MMGWPSAQKITFDELESWKRTVETAAVLPLLRMLFISVLVT